MPAIDININHLMSEAAGSAASMNGLGGDKSSANYFTTLLNRLDNTLKKLDATLTSQMSKKDLSGNSMEGGSNGGLKAMASTIAASLATALGVTTARFLNNQANAIMGRATNVGNFVAQAIQGNANQNFGKYAANFVNIEAQRRIANTFAAGEGMGGGAGGVAGAGLGAAFGMLGGAIGTLIGPEGTAAGAVTGAELGTKLGHWGAAFLGGTGAAAGKLGAASNNAQFIQADALMKAAVAERKANASVSEWKTGFSRFGMQMTDQTLLGGDITGGAPLAAPLQMEFEKKYGGSQNYNAILNNIVPYLNSNPMSAKTGDLNNISQQFLKAGFAVSDFSRLTMQSSQYAALTGNYFQDFTNDLVNARAKFGDAYDVNANQTALNLMQLGFGKDQAQHLANQSLYNQGTMSGVSMLANSTYSQYYQREALSNVGYGIDINKSLASGQLIGKNGKVMTGKSLDRIKSDLAIAMKGGPQTLGMASLQTAGIGLPLLAALTQGQVAEGKIKNVKSLLNPDLSPGQAAANQAGGTFSNLLSNVNSMMVNASQVTLINSGAQVVDKAINTITNYFTPSPHGGTHNPSTKH